MEQNNSSELNTKKSGREKDGKEDVYLLAGYDPISHRIKIKKVLKARLEIGDLVSLATPDGQSKAKLITLSEVNYPIYEMEFEIIAD